MYSRAYTESAVAVCRWNIDIRTAVSREIGNISVSPNITDVEDIYPVQKGLLYIT